MASAIPVRKHPTGGRRSAVLNEIHHGNTRSEAPVVSEKTKQRKRSSENSPTKPTTRHGTMKELIEENTKHREELKQQKGKVQDLQTELNDMRERLTLSTTESGEKSENLKDLTQKRDQLQQKCRKLEEKMLMSNIDPVTLKHLDEDHRLKDTVFEDYTNTKEQVKKLKEQIEQLNLQTSKSLDTLYAIDKQLEGINTEMDSILST